MKGLKRIFSFVVVLCMCFNLFSLPFTVHADEATYAVYDKDTCFLYSSYEVNNNTVYGYVGTNIDGRIVGLRDTVNSPIYLYLVMPADNSTGYYYYQEGTTSIINGSCPLGNDYWNYNLTVDGIKYFYYRVTLNYTGNETLYFPIITGRNQPLSNIVYYTYGAGAVAPDPEVRYGRPADVSYSSKLAGSGNASSENIDRITWDNSRDTEGNDLPSGARIQIRAIPGRYTGNSKQNLLSQAYTDFVIDNTKALQLADIVASRGVFEIKWSEVVSHFSNNFGLPFSPLPYIVAGDSYWYADGWIYQLRLQIDDYYSDWVMCYSVTSSGQDVANEIINSDTMTQNLVQNIEIVNNLNGVVENWQINQTVISMEVYEEPGEGEKPWWAYLLEAILGTWNITNNYIENGNGDTQLIIYNTNNYNDDLNTKLNEYNTIEDQQIQNLDDSLEAIDTDSPILSDNKFIQSANWVTQQYNRMTSGTVIGSLIGFSLLFGLALIFIGKIR